MRLRQISALGRLGRSACMPASSFCNEPGVLDSILSNFVRIVRFDHLFIISCVAVIISEEELVPYNVRSAIRIHHCCTNDGLPGNSPLDGDHDDQTSAFPILKFGNFRAQQPLNSQQPRSGHGPVHKSCIAAVAVRCHPPCYTDDWSARYQAPLLLRRR